MTDFNVVAGDDFTVTVAVNARDGSPAALVSPVAYFSAKQIMTAELRGQWENRVYFERVNHESFGLDNLLSIDRNSENDPSVRITKVDNQWFVYADILSADTAAAIPGLCGYQFRIEDGGKRNTIRKGQFVIVKSLVCP